MPAERDDVVVFRSGLLHEADLVASSLEQARIPHYRRSEILGGPELAMPAAPAQGPGLTWTVRVPSSRAPEAMDLIHELPVRNVSSPGPWGFHPTAGARRIWRVYAIVVLACAIAGVIGGAWSLVSGLLK
jgi:hypothetical protein